MKWVIYACVLTGSVSFIQSWVTQNPVYETNALLYFGAAYLFITKEQ